MTDSADKRDRSGSSGLATPALGIFVGAVAAANLAKAGDDRPQKAMDHAAKLRRRGASEATIYAETSKMLEGSPYAGVSYGADGRPRFEISDEGAKLRPAGLDKSGRGMLGDVLEHEAYYQAHPEARFLGVTKRGESGGGYTGTEIRVGDNHFAKAALAGRTIAKPTARGVILHELQHNAQDTEGHAPGGSPRDFEDRFPGERNEAIRHQLYDSLAGEVEAENTRERANMTAAERRRTGPSRTAKVSRQDQIVTDRHGTVVENAFRLQEMFGGDLPKGYHVKRETDSIGRTNYAIMNGKRKVGNAYVRDLGDRVQVGRISIDPKHQRKGIATALYAQIERDLGKPLVPDGNLSPDAHALWQKHRPEALANHRPLKDGGAVEDPLGVFKSQYRLQEMAESIKDFGEKIGGARKDRAVKGGPRRPRPVDPDTRPAWMKRFVAAETIDRTSKQGTGKWVLLDTRTKGYLGGHRQASRTEFASAAEAERAIPLLAVSQKHRVRAGDNNTFEIWRQVTDRKSVKATPETFPSREAAMRYMTENAATLLGSAKGYGEEILATPETVKRTGPGWRAADTAPDQFLKDFKFRGVEFGNWQGDRQQVMNYAYDAMRDLADVTGIAPESLTFQERLGLAFGARGKGGKQGGRATYQRDYAAVNLTKTKGAGSLAHEWAHGLDHYLGTLDDPKLGETRVNQHGETVFNAAGREVDYASHRVGQPRLAGQLNETVRAAYKDLMETMLHKKEQVEVEVGRYDGSLKYARDTLERELKSARDELASAKTYGKRFTAPATAEQLAAFDALADKLRAGEDLTTRHEFNNPNLGLRERGAMAGRWTNDTLEGMSKILQQVRGRSGFDSQNNHGYLDRIRAGINAVKSVTDKIAAAKASPTQVITVPTEFARNSNLADRARTDAYWGTRHEMFARAFSSYIEDKLQAANRRSDYLSYGSQNVLYEMLHGIKPFPEGAERQAINAKFDNLFEAMRQTEVLRPSAPNPVRAAIGPTSAAEAMAQVKGQEVGPGLRGTQNPNNLAAIVENRQAANEPPLPKLAAARPPADFMARAEELGRAAQRTGGSSAPAQDAAFMNLLKEGKDYKAADLMVAWSKGWTAEHAAAPVPGVTDAETIAKAKADADQRFADTMAETQRKIQATLEARDSAELVAARPGAEAYGENKVRAQARANILNRESSTGTYVVERTSAGWTVQRDPNATVKAPTGEYPVIPQEPLYEIRNRGNSKQFFVYADGKPIKDAKGQDKWFGSKDKAEKYLAGRQKTANQVAGVSAPAKGAASARTGVSHAPRPAVVGDNGAPADTLLNAAKRLESVAKRTITAAEQEVNRPRLMNTARRARMGSGMIEEAQQRIADAKTALKIAEALRNGEAGALSTVKSLADIRELRRLAKEAEWATDRKQGRSYKPGGHGLKPEDVTNVGGAKGYVRLEPSTVEELRTALAGKKGLAADFKTLARYADTAKARNSFETSDPAVFKAIQNVANAVKKADKLNVERPFQAKSLKWSANKYLEEVRDFNRKVKLAGTDPAARQEALKAFLDVRAGKVTPSPAVIAERELIGMKLPGFFPTPESLAKRMADLADIRSGQTVLEPSAGTGRLADAAKALGAQVDTVEMQSRLRDILTKKGHNLVASDFTEIPAEPKYDRILMNPPFEKGQDMVHVQRAYEMLKPGGKMVAVMGEGGFFRSDKQATGFRSWLDSVGGTSEKLPEGTFKESNTGVNTRLVTISKPAATAEAAMAASTGARPGWSDAAREASIEARAAETPTVSQSKVPKPSEIAAMAEDKPKRVQEMVERPKLSKAVKAKITRMAEKAAAERGVYRAQLHAAAAVAEANTPERQAQMEHYRAALDRIQAKEARAGKTSGGLTAAAQEAGIRLPDLSGMKPEGMGKAPQSTPDWLAGREEAIKASRAAGNTHLDSLPRAVEGMRGVPFRNVHDPKERGTVRTVSNTGDVVVDWADEYSAHKNLAETVKEGKKTVARSWLAPTDLKDYVAEPKGKPVGWSDKAREASAKERGVALPGEAKAAQALTFDRTKHGSGQPNARGWKVIDVDVAKVEQALQDNPLHVGRGGTGGSPERIASIKSATKPLPVPVLGVNSAGAGFDDGRHRFAAARDAGAKTIPVYMDPESVRYAARQGIIGKEHLSSADLRTEAKAAGIKGVSKMSKSALLEALGKSLNKAGAVAMVAAPAVAAYVAFDATKSEAKAVGATPAEAMASAATNAAVAGGATAGVMYGIGKVIGAGLKMVATKAPALAGPVGLAVAGGLTGYAAYSAYQRNKDQGVGTGLKAAALSVVGADALVDASRTAPEPAPTTVPHSGPVRLTDSQKAQFATANAAYQGMQQANKDAQNTGGNPGWSDAARVAAYEARMTKLGKAPSNPPLVRSQPALPPTR